MKYSKIVKENMKGKSTFLIASVCCIVLLLTICYFGVNSPTKGTTAATTYTCPTGYTLTYDWGSSSEVYGYYCCPSGYGAKTESNGQITFDGIITADLGASEDVYCTRNNIPGYLVTADSFKTSGSSTFCAVETTNYNALSSTKWECDTNASTAGLYSCTTYYIDECAVVAQEANRIADIPTASTHCWNPTYNGSTQTVTMSPSAGYTFSGTTSAINAGNYVITATLSTGHMWADGSTTTKTFNCSIEKAKATIPTSTNYCRSLTYNGSYQTLTTTDGGTGYTFDVNTTTAKNAGTHSVTAKLLNPNYVWSDGATSTKTISCSISKATPTLTPSTTNVTFTTPTAKTVTYTYNGDGNVTCSSSKTSVATCSVNASNKQVVITPKANGSAVITLSASAGTNYNAISKTINVSMTGGITIPTASSYCKNSTYNGSEQTITNTAGTGYTFSGNKKTNAGSYAVTATLSSGYIWSDGSSEAKTFNCSISKATPTLTPGKTSVSLTIPTAQTIDYTYNGDGNVTCSSSSSSIATCSVKTSTKEVVITPVAKGDATITLSAGAGTNYNAATSKTVAVSVANAASTPTSTTIPTASNYCSNPTYNGSEQTITKTAGTGYTFSGNKKTNVGSYAVTATLSSGYIWSDGSSEAKTFNCSISKATPTLETITSLTLTYPTAQTKNYSYNGDGTVTCKSSSDSIVTCSVKTSTKELVITPVAKGAATLTLSASAGTNYNAATPKTVAISVSVTDGGSTPTSTTIPTASNYCSNPTYNGSEQTITKTAGTGYTFSGNKKTNVGSYAVTATLSSGYIWSDGSSEAKTFNCSISKATPTLTPSKTSVSLTIPTAQTIDYTYNGDGNVTCSSSSSSIATCSVKTSTKEVVITPVAKGDATITLSAGAGTNYNAATSKTVAVSVAVTGSQTTTVTKTFKATFNENGGTINGKSELSCSTTSSSCSIKDLPTATRDGYKFNGWWTSATCTSGKSDSLTLDAHTTYYACWNKITGTDNEGNVTNNQQTGDIAMYIVWAIGIGAIGYSLYYFKSFRKN